MALVIEDVPFNLRFSLRLVEYLSRKVKHIGAYGFAGMDKFQTATIQEVVNAFYFDPDSSLLTTSIDTFQTLYWTNIEFQGKTAMDVAIISIYTTWFTGIQILRIDPNGDPKEVLPIFEREIEELNHKFDQFDASVKADYLNLPVLSISDLINRIDRVSEKVVRARLAGMHSMNMVRAYFHDDDIVNALLHAKLAHYLLPTANFANTYGYICLTSNKIDEAASLLEKARMLAITEEDSLATALSTYNLGLIKVKKQLFSDALSDFNLLVAILNDIEKDKRRCSELLIPIITQDGNVHFNKISDPDMLEVVKNAIKSVSSHLLEIGYTSSETSTE